MNLQDFMDKFGTKEQCLDDLYKMRWPNEFRCPRCKHDQKYALQAFKYKCRNCGYQTTVTAGTIFHGKHIPITDWYLAIWHFVSKENRLTALELRSILELGSNRTAQAMLRQLKDIMIQLEQQRLRKLAEPEKLHGIIDVCRDSIRTPKGSATVAVAAEVLKTKVGRVYMSVTESGHPVSLNDFIQNNVASNSTVVCRANWSDSHDLLNNGYALADPSTLNYVSYARKIILKLESWLHKISPKAFSIEHLDDYLNNYCIEHNSQKFKATKAAFNEILLYAVRHQSIR